MLSKETYLFKDILDLTIQGQVQGFGLIIFSAKIPRPHNTVRFLNLITHQEVLKLFIQQGLRGLVDKTTDQQTQVQQFETDRRLWLKNFLLIFLDLIIHQEIPKLKLVSQQEFRGVENNNTSEMPKVQQLEFTGSQDQQATAATSGSEHQDIYIYIYYKFCTYSEQQQRN